MKLKHYLSTDSAIIAVFTGFGVLIGVAFDITVAAKFGLSNTADAYFAAITIPVIITNAVLLSSQKVLIVSLTQSQSQLNSESVDKGQGGKVFSTLLNAFILIGFVISIVGSVASPFLMRFLTPGLDAFSMDTASEVSRILYLRIPAASASIILQSLLYSRRHIMAGASGNFMPGLVTLLLLFSRPELPIQWVAVSIVIGAWSGLIWLIILSTTLRIEKYLPTLDLRNPVIRNIARALLVPLAGLLMRQSILLAERWFGSLMGPGYVAALGYANKIIKVFAGTFFDSLSTASLPALTNDFTKKIYKSVLQEWRRLLTLSIIIGLILSAGIYLISDPLVHFLFSSRTQDLGNLQLSEMALILSIYGLSLIPMGPFRAQQSFLYAAKDPKTVGRLLLIATITTLLLDWPLVTLFGASGLGIAFTAGIIVGLLFGFRFTRIHLTMLKTIIPQ